MHRPLPHLVVLAALAAGVLAGCGIDEDVVAREAAEAVPPATEGSPPDDTTTTAPAEDAPLATPFAVADLPAGYVLRRAGVGETEPGDDAHPVTVLAPDGEPVGSGVVFVEAVPAPSDEDDRSEGSDGPDGWVSLTVAHGDGDADGAVRVWALGATDDELEDIADAAEPPDRPGDAPRVADPPTGLEVVGSITADGVVALRAGDLDDIDEDDLDDAPVPGPTSARTAVWATCGPDDDDSCSSLLAMTVPGDALDPPAVVTEARLPRRTTDDPRDAVAQGVFVEIATGEATGVVTTTADPATGAVVRRELEVGTAWGDVLVLVSRGADVLDADALVALAESTTEVDEGAWDDFAG